MFFEVFAKEEVVLLGEDGSCKQVLERKVLSDVLQDLPPVEQVLALLHNIIIKELINHTF